MAGHKCNAPFLLLLLPGLFLFFSLIAGRESNAKKYSWEKRSFEDADYDPEADTVEFPDVDSRNWKPIRVCGEEKAGCVCMKGGNQTLHCGSAKLDSANLVVDRQFGEVNIARLEGNEISYLFQRKILPGHEKNLLVLDLSQNQIEDIEPGAFDRFQNLLELKLTHNNLNELSSDIFSDSLKSLHHLHLDYNFLEKLDNGLFDNLVSLTKLVLDGNRRLQISNKVLTKALAKLEVLSLDRCSIKKLEIDIFANLPNLRALSLSSNPLRTIPLAISAAQLPALQVLALSDTLLEQLDAEELYRAAPNLQRLFMRKMKNLKRIGDCAFCKLDKLESLDFSESKSLAELHANAFGKTAPKKFTSLNLKNCGLSTLAEEIFKNADWKRMEMLRLSGNPWKCDCGLQWLPKLANLKIADMPTCALPQNMRGLTLKQSQDRLECAGMLPTEKEGPTSMGKFAVFLVFMVLCASLLVFGAVYARKRYNLMNAEGGGNFPIPRFMGGNTTTIDQMGFEGGRTFLADEYDNDFEEECEEAQVRIGEKSSTIASHGEPKPEFV